MSKLLTVRERIAIALHENESRVSQINSIEQLFQELFVPEITEGEIDAMADYYRFAEGDD